MLTLSQQYDRAMARAAIIKREKPHITLWLVMVRYPADEALRPSLALLGHAIIPTAREVWEQQGAIVRTVEVL